MRAILLLWICAAAIAAQTAPGGVSYRALKYPKLPEVKVPEVTQFKLPNGIRVYLLENHELPLVGGFALVRTGNLFDPADKVGLAGITGSVMRTGGTRTKTGEELDQQLENVAASVEAGIGETSGSVSFSALKENTDDVLAIWKDVMVNPEFRQDKLDLAKSQTKSMISRRNDEAEDIMAREFEGVMYGRDNPYGWRMEYAHIDNIKREDLVAFHQRYFFPENIMIAVQGDFTTSEMRQKLEKLFADWTAKQPAVPPFPEVKAKAAPGIYLATKQDVAQTFFTFGHLGGILKDPNYPALSIMSDILGGGFSSRLFRSVRIKLGLAYNISAGWGANYAHPGVFRVSGSTKSSSTVDAIEAARQEIARIQTEQVTDQELETAKQSVLNSFVFSFDSPAKTLNRVVTYDYWGYPKDFIFQYQKGVQAVTKADVLRVAKQYLRLPDVATVAVGNPAEFGKPLTALGKVQNIDLTIPQPKTEQAKADNASLARGKQMLARVQQAVGGAEKLASLKDLTQSVDASLQGGQIKAKQLNQWIAPGIIRQTQELPFGKVIAFYDGKEGWLSTPPGVVPMPPPVAQQVRGEAFRSYASLLLSDRHSDRQVNAVGENTVEITDGAGNKVQMEIDPQTGLPAKYSYTSTGMGGAPSSITNVLSDWKDVGGLKFPHKMTISQGGQPFAEAVVTDIKVNTGLSAQELSNKP